MTIQHQFWRTQQEELRRKLEEFEVCIETPFVPGELANWMDDAHKAFQELSPQLQLQTRHIHAAEFAEIANEDPELLGRVDEMREEDADLMKLLGKIANWLERIGRELQRGTSETDLKQDLDELVSANLDWVMRIRKQEVAIRTWLVEAFTRDRGTVD